MALKSNFEESKDIFSPFVDEVANPGDQRSIGRQVRDNEALAQVAQSEAAQGEAPKINLARALGDLVVPKAARDKVDKVKNTK